jgi:hypothetical protein
VREYAALSAEPAVQPDLPHLTMPAHQGLEPRSFRDWHQDAEHIARVRDMERRNKQATQEFLPRWNEAEKATRADRKKRTGTD